MPWLISAAQADKFRKSQKALILLDASLHMPTTGRDAQKEFADKHIAGARFFDIDAFNDPTSELPHSLIQDETLINEKLSQLGVRNDFKIIFYDNSDLKSACRALWMMKIFGHNPHQLYILDGGLAAWEKYRGKIESGVAPIAPKAYQAKFQSQQIVTLAQMKQIVQQSATQVVDLRHPVRFAGGAEPRPHLRQGHMPGSLSFPYTNFFDKDGKFLPLDKIRKLLESVAIDVRVPTVATCGGGVTATILDFILDLMETAPHAVYPGSWSEWGLNTLLPGEQSIEERPVVTSIEHDLPGKVI